MPRRSSRPDIRSQFGFLRTRLPLFLLAAGIIFAMSWKALLTQKLENQLFEEQRVTASWEGELQLLKTRYEGMCAFARIERDARRIGMVWPRDGVAHIVLGKGQARRANTRLAGGRP